MHRVGIIPFELAGDDAAVLFVTSQSRGRWVLPKGRREKGESNEDTCHREGFEEAGVRGILFHEFPTTAVIGKMTRNVIQLNPVTFYPYLITEQLDSWPEMSERLRQWLPLEDALEVHGTDDYLVVLQQFKALLPWIRTAAASPDAAALDDPPEAL